MGEARQMQRSFVFPTPSVGTPQDDRFPTQSGRTPQDDNRRLASAGVGRPLYKGGPKAKRSCRISAIQFLGQTEATDVVENKQADDKLGKAKILFKMNKLKIVRNEANLNLGRGLTACLPLSDSTFRILPLE